MKPTLLLIAHYYDFDTYENRRCLIEELQSINDYMVTLLQTIPTSSLKAGSIRNAVKPLNAEVKDIKVINIVVPDVSKALKSINRLIYRQRLQRADDNAGEFDLNLT